MLSFPPLEEKNGGAVQKVTEWEVVRSASCNENIAKINHVSWTYRAHVFLIGRDCSLKMWLWNCFGLRFKLAGNAAVLISALGICKNFFFQFCLYWAQKYLYFLIFLNPCAGEVFKFDKYLRTLSFSGPVYPMETFKVNGKSILGYVRGEVKVPK